MTHPENPAIRRVRYMEACFDMLLQAFEADPAIRKDPVFAACLEILLAYYQGGQWLQDYEMDEQGLLPPDLKRGVLSQDGVHDFLASLAE